MHTEGSYNINTPGFAVSRKKMISSMYNKRTVSMTTITDYRPTPTGAVRKNIEQEHFTTPNSITVKPV